ncbi:hypothetical protein SEUCBS139899_008808 [Sporothrix eucalyptigena]
MTNQPTIYLGKYAVDYQGGRRRSPHRQVMNNNGSPSARSSETKITVHKNRHINGFFTDGNIKDMNSPMARPFQKKGSNFFNSQGPSYRGDGRDSTFGKHQRPPHEMRPFSTFMPFSIDSHPKDLDIGTRIKQKFSEMNPGISDEGPHMNYIYRNWARTPDQPLSESKYGDGYKRDDMTLCDCDGKMSRCFVAAYIELARKLYKTEKKLS